MYVFLSEICLEEEEEEYKNYFRINLECFDNLFVLAKDIITKQTTNMKDASVLKPKFDAETFHIHSFIV